MYKIFGLYPYKNLKSSTGMDERNINQNKGFNGTVCMFVRRKYTPACLNVLCNNRAGYVLEVARWQSLFGKYLFEMIDSFCRGAKYWGSL